MCLGEAGLGVGEYREREAEEEADMKVNSGNNSKINETLHAEPNVNVRTHTRRMFV